MIEKVEYMALLFDFYGNLLTEKQRDILSLYYDQDFYHNRSFYIKQIYAPQRRMP